MSARLPSSWSPPDGYFWTFSLKGNVFDETGYIAGTKEEVFSPANIAENECMDCCESNAKNALKSTDDIEKIKSNDEHEARAN